MRVKFAPIFIYFAFYIIKGKNSNNYNIEQLTSNYKFQKYTRMSSPYITVSRLNTNGITLIKLSLLYF